MSIDRREMLRASLAAAGLGSSAIQAEVNTDSAAGRGRRQPDQPAPTGITVVRRKRYDRHPRILLITSEADPRSREALEQLQAEDGAFALLRERGWLIGRTLNVHIQIVERMWSARYVRLDPAAPCPWAGCLSFGRLLRSTDDRPDEPLDASMLYWLLTGNDTDNIELSGDSADRLEALRYPAEGGFWSIQGDDHPIQEVLLSHLESRMHRYRIPGDWQLQDWTYSELRALHDDLHRWGRARALVAVQ